MKNKNINFRDHLFSYILAPLIIIIGIISYYRFIINNDYLIGYEGICDPKTEKCFLGCEDDACTQEYFYSKIQKYAPDLYNECGNNITDCEQANICLPSDHNCSITYCNSEVDGDVCSKMFTEKVVDNNEVDSTEENLLPINNKNP